MRRILVTAVVLAITLVALSVNVVPMRCGDCGAIITRTNAYSALFGGHEYRHGLLMDGCRFRAPAPAGSVAPNVAATQAEAAAGQQI